MPGPLIAPIRAARLALHLASGLAMATVYPWLGPVLRRHILQCWSGNLLRILNVRVEFEGAERHALHHGLIVSNHVSWLDVFVLNAVVPMRFVAKSEVRAWPVVGWLCARAQTLFIERGKARSAARMNVQLVELLRRGECLAVFPEGTTTDGSKVAHFHASLLQPAIDAGVPVHPLAIRYQDSDGAFSTTAAYIGDMSLSASLWKVLRTPSLHVRLAAAPPLEMQGVDRRTLARTAREHVGTALRQMDSPNIHLPLTDVQHPLANLSPSRR